MKTFSALLAICAGNSPVTVEFPAQRPVTRSLMFPLICAWINGWVNYGEAGDLIRHCVHYDVTVITHRRFGDIIQQIPAHQDSRVNPPPPPPPPPLGDETGVFPENKVNTIVIDRLAPCVARSSTAMVLTKRDQYVYNFREGGFPWPGPYLRWQITENAIYMF